MPNGKWTLERFLLVLTCLCTVLGFTFGLGVNWSRITSQEARQDAFERTYLRADVYNSDQRRLSESIERLADELAALRQQQAAPAMRSPQSGQQPGRMFDR
jgi:cell division protein FtsX